MSKNKILILSLTLSLFAAQAFAQVNAGPYHTNTYNIDTCDPDDQDCTSPSIVTEPSKEIYPYRPFTTEYIQDRLNALHEGSSYISNVYDMEKKGLNRANTKVQPWGGSYWPLYQGQIANTYQDKDYKTFVLSAGKNLSWKKNFSDYQKRAKKVHPKIYKLSEKELSKLAPSEKYDILLGDTSFDLTNRIWNFIEKWGLEKQWGFLSAIELPNGYGIPKASNRMALWEGICHGWAVAAGHSPRPEKTVYVTLPNGKKMPFYPNDIKALISLMWANSIIQSDVIFEGNRCNRKNPDKDKYGRYIDTKLDRNDTTLLPRCADVHPGIFHVTLVNILGVEGRSFIVDKTAEAAIANQPVSGYELSYFNPLTQNTGPLARSVISRKDYGVNDPFKDYRNSSSTHIVGVEVKLKYVDWEFPYKKETNSPLDDKLSDFSFLYDLELDSKGNVVGGQWRVTKTGGENIFKNKTHQPDFFWVIPRNWRNYFRSLDYLPEWDIGQSSLPPEEFTAAARGAHSFIYEESERYFSESPLCLVNPVGEGGPMKVKCEFRYPRPQPLINVVETLLRESRK